MIDAERLLALLDGADVDFVVIGGLAAIMQGGALPTVDVDIMYDRSRANLERLAGVLQELRVRLRGAEDLDLRPDQRLLQRGDRFTFTSDLGDLDIFATADGTDSYRQVKERADTVFLGSFDVLIASLDDLIAMKRAANRPKDQPKLAELLELRRLIEERGE